MHKDCERILISEAEIKTMVKSMADKINEDYKDKNLLLQIFGKSIDYIIKILEML